MAVRCIAMAEITTLERAISELVTDGCAVALEGFTHLVPFAAGREIIRQRPSELELIRMTPDLIYDQLVGAGVARTLVFSWGGNPGVGSLFRLREAIEKGDPHPVTVREHTHFELANRYVAGASGVPFVVARAGGPTDLDDISESVTHIECPFTGQRVRAIRAINPDVGIVHAQQADRQGNVQLWGIVGVQKEVVLASRRSLVTVEEVVEELSPHPQGIVLPSWTIDYVAEAPGGAAPSYALGYYERDNDAYRAWDAISRDKTQFAAWLSEVDRGE